MPAMISQASSVDSWAAEGLGSRSEGGGCRTVLPTTTASRRKPTIQNAYAS
jgi:hypothetical protein